MLTVQMKSVAAFSALVMVSACASTLPPPPPTAPTLAPVETASACADRNFPIYFASDQTDLDATARQAIALAVEEAGNCELSAIEIIAQSDAIGSDTVNMSVSQERADAVLEALLAADLDVEQIAIVALGESNAVTEDNLINPMNRRVDVYFRE